MFLSFKTKQKDSGLPAFQSVMIARKVSSFDHQLRPSFKTKISNIPELVLPSMISLTGFVARKEAFESRVPNDEVERITSKMLPSPP